MYKKLIIKNKTRKVDVEVFFDNTPGKTDDYYVIVTDDNEPDAAPGIPSSKTTQFAKNNMQINQEKALNFFNKKVEFFEKELNAKAQEPIATQVINNIQSIRNKFFLKSNNSNTLK